MRHLPGVDRWLPSQKLDLPHPAGVEDGNARLVKALAEEAAIPLPGYRVRGEVQGEAVHLWYSLRRRPASFAPRLRARWEGDGAAARLVGEYRHERDIARLVLWTGIAFGAALLVLGVRNALPWYWTLGGVAFFAGYPWVAWFINGNHVEKMDELVRRALGAAPG